MTCFFGAALLGAAFFLAAAFFGRALAAGFFLVLVARAFAAVRFALPVFFAIQPPHSRGDSGEIAPGSTADRLRESSREVVN
jgi:hypothetical protein